MDIEHHYTAPEEILAVIPNVTLQAGFMGVKSRQHSLIFTTTRIIFARLTVARMNELTQQAKTSTSELSTAVYDLLTQIYSRMGPEGILADNEANFAVDRATVKNVKVKTTAGPEGGVGSDVLILKAAKTYKVTLGGSKAAAKAALEAAGLT